MNIANVLLRAESVGVRNFRNGLSHFIAENKPLIITERGSPASVLLPYNDILEIVDVLEELEDKQVLKLVAQGRRAIRKGLKGIPVFVSFKRGRPREL
ncbi:MAG: hypothetical protein V1933_06340 [Candidatus Omnitrophota bacterium]